MILGVVILIAFGGVLLLSNSQRTSLPTGGIDGGSTGGAPATQPTFIEFNIESRGLSFTPNEIKAKVGDTVRVIYRNNLGTHDFVIDEFNVRSPLINEGEIAAVEFLVDKRGVFEFYCSVPGHREAGMKGTLIVE